MFRRTHHQKILAILEAMDVAFLQDAKCYFAGGTAISMMLGEYRESIDIDFLCADQDGYRKLRSTIFDNDMGEVFKNPVKLLRDVRTDRDAIRTFILMEETPIKFEIVREARVQLEGGMIDILPVPCLSKMDLFVEKLLANADRYGDRSVMSRDVIDLMMMQHAWGNIPDEAWCKAESAYGDSIDKAFNKARSMLLSDREYLESCLKNMSINPDEEGNIIVNELQKKPVKRIYP